MYRCIATRWSLNMFFLDYFIFDNLLTQFTHRCRKRLCCDCFQIFLRLLTHCTSAPLSIELDLCQYTKLFDNSIFIAFSCSNEVGKVCFAYFLK